MGRQTMGHSGSKGLLPTTVLFSSRPPLLPTPIPLPSYSPSSVRGLALSASVKDLLSKGVIEPASSEPGFYSRLFVTARRSQAVGAQL